MHFSPPGAMEEMPLYPPAELLAGELEAATNLRGRPIVSVKRRCREYVET